MGIKVSTFVDNNAPQCDALYLNTNTEETNKRITETGQTVTTANTNQLGIAIAEYVAQGDFYTDSGVANAYVLNLPGTKQGINSLKNGQRFRFIPGNSNTGACTVNIQGASGFFGVKNIKKNDGTTDPASGDLTADREVILSYDLSNDVLRIFNTEGGGAINSVPLLSRDINQVSHGLSIGNVVRFNGTNYITAQADTFANSEAVGIVSSVIDVDNFTLAYGGYITGLSGLTSGSVHYLSDTVAGQLTNTEPTASGVISKPLLIANSTTSGYIFNQRGLESPIVNELLHIQEQQASGVNANIAGTTSYTKVLINTVLTNEINGASLNGSNQIILPSGNYYVEGYVPIFSGSDITYFLQSRLQNVTDATTTILGQSTRVSCADSQNAFFFGKFSINANKTFEVQGRTSDSNNRFGAANSYGTEIYSDIRIWRIK